jgi:four helix bundle protein
MKNFALIDQLKRASTSIELNIAEGTGGLGDIEFKKFLRDSLKSLYETVAGLKIAERLFKVDVASSLDKCALVGKELNALINSLTNDKTSNRLKTNV